MTKLALEDIADLRAYERERQDFRTDIIALKKRRRIPVGPHLTFLFENRDTIRFQIQEMARAEKILSDEGIQTELDIYNPMIPEPGTLAATMFVELTTDEQLREWLPKLVGIETSAVFRLGSGVESETVRCVVDADHGKQLTRDEITASVHYIHFSFTPEQIERFATDEVALLVDHAEYGFDQPLSEDNRRELLADLRG